MRIQCRSNLEITLALPWGKVKYWRNKATHETYQFTKDEAIEVLQYTKVLLFDTELIPGQDISNSISTKFVVRRCHNRECGVDVADEWKYCPSCGERTYQKCTRCKRQLDPEWAICPFCNLSRGRMKNREEQKHLYKAYCEAIWADYIITPEENRFLEIKRLEFGLTPEEAKQLEKMVIPESYMTFLSLVEACSVDQKIDEMEEEFLQKKAVLLGLQELTARKIIQNQRELLENNSSLTHIRLME